MMSRIEAAIDEQGNVRLLEPMRLVSSRRALVTILEGSVIPIVSESALLSEDALAEDWNRAEQDEAWWRLQQAS